MAPKPRKTVSGIEDELARAAALIRAQRLEEARRLCGQVLRVQADHPRACHLMAVTALFEGDYGSAERWLSRAIAQDAGNAAYHCDHGVALAKLGRHAEAIDACQRALDIRPELLAVHFQAGQSLRALHREAEAAAAFRHVVRLQPDALDAWMALGETCIAQHRFEEAAEAFENAVRLSPNTAECHYLLGLTLFNQNRTDDAIAAFDRAIRMNPAHHRARLCRSLAPLQVVYASDSELETRRNQYAESLAKLRRDCLDQGSPAVLAAAARAVGAMQPYYLPYQGRNDRDLQALYGDLVCRMMAAAFPQWQDRPIVAATRVDRRIRVGFVSGYFHDHSVWKMPLRGWLEGLNRDRFVVLGYNTEGYRDPVTDHAAALCDRFVQGPLSVADWARTIRKDDPHVLIYPEIGMNPAVAALAALRLAPVQCNSWGHPVTSGYPTIDVFLGSELMEPSDAETQYTERLVRLANLSVAYEPRPSTPVPMTREDLGLRPDAVVFATVQNLAKYLPDHDHVFPRVAAEIGNCQFMFVQNESGVVTDAFRKRMRRAFDRYGLTWDRHVALSPRMKPDAFAAALSLCDAFLDSIGWSGCNTTMEALNAGLPVIGFDGWNARGRHTAAILAMIGMDDLTAHSPDEYVSLAIRMARDAPWRQANADRVIERRDRAYRDDACIVALEAFLTEAAEGSLGR